jgi:hypothetical protein
MEAKNNNPPSIDPIALDSSLSGELFPINRRELEIVESAIALDPNFSPLFPSTQTGTSEITVSAIESTGLNTTETFEIAENDTIPSNADLVVTSFNAEPDHVLGGETSVNFTIANQGGANASRFEAEILYYTADNTEELTQEEPFVVKTVSFEQLASGEEILTTSEAVSLPLETLLAEALADDPSLLGRPVPEQGFFESNQIDHLGIRIVNAESSGEDEDAFANNSVDGTAGVNLDKIAFFPWDFLNNQAEGIVQGGEDDLISDGAVTSVDANAVFQNVDRVITEDLTEDPNFGLDLERIDFDLDGVISTIDAVRIANRVGYQINPNVSDDGEQEEALDLELETASLPNEALEIAVNNSDGEEDKELDFASETATLPNEVLEISVSFQDLEGNSIEKVSVGDTFEIVLSVEDLREAENQFGVFSAIADVNYDTVFAEINDVSLTPEFNFPVGEARINNNQGLVNEIGGFTLNEEMTLEPFAILTATATTQGVFEVSMDAGEGEASFNTIRGFDNDVNANTMFLSETLQITNNELSDSPLTTFDNLVFGTANNDRLNAADQDNPYTGDNQIAFLGAGEDTIDGIGALGNNRIYASSDNDEIFAAPGDRVLTNGGDDEILAASDNRIFAGKGNDRIDGSQGNSNNRLYGQAGNDDLFAGNNDVLHGGEGDDRLFIRQEGDNLLTGSAGADQFWIATAEIPNRLNTITDFTSGEDLIGLGGFPNLAFADLILIQEDSHTIISLGADSEFVEEDTPLAELQGIPVNSLTENDFTFATQAPV